MTRVYVRNITRSIIESWGLTHLSTILSLIEYTCKDGLSCTVYVTNDHIVYQLMIIYFFCIDPTYETFKRKQTPERHTVFVRSLMK